MLGVKPTFTPIDGSPSIGRSSRYLHIDFGLCSIFSRDRSLFILS